LTTCPLRSFHRGKDEECLEDACSWWVPEIDACSLAILAKSKLFLITTVDKSEDLAIN